MYKRSFAQWAQDDIFRWSWVILWCAAIFYSSHRPVPPNLSETETFVGIDLIYHFVVYGVLGFLYFKVRPQWKALFIFVFLYGVSDELHQSFMPFREFEVSDIVMDTLGGCVGGFLCQKFIKS